MMYVWINVVQACSDTEGLVFVCCLVSKVLIIGWLPA